MDILVRLEQGEFTKAELGDHLALQKLNLSPTTLCSVANSVQEGGLRRLLCRLSASALGTEDRSRRGPRRGLRAVGGGALGCARRLLRTRPCRKPQARAPALQNR